MRNPADQYNPFAVGFDVNAPGEASFVWGEIVDDVTESATGVFYHLNVVNAWNRAMLVELPIYDVQILVFADQTGQFFATNAGYMPANAEQGMPDMIMFGAGSDSMSNFGTITEVVYHEYTHAITAQFYDEESQEDEFRAIHEGLADYFAGTILNSPDVGIGFYIYDPLTPLRSMDNDLHYVDDWEGEAHVDGTILSAALWEIREEIGAEITDDLVYFARYGQPLTFGAVYDEMLFLDDDNDDLEDGTPNFDVINAAFANHGIVELFNSVDEISSNASQPRSLVLESVYPNPFNATTRLSFSLQKSERVQVVLVNILGAEVAKIWDGNKSAGSHALTFTADHVSSGTYFLNVRTAHDQATQKIVLLK